MADPLYALTAIGGNHICKRYRAHYASQAISEAGAVTGEAYDVPAYSFEDYTHFIYQNGSFLTPDQIPGLGPGADIQTVYSTEEFTGIDQRGTFVYSNSARYDAVPVNAAIHSLNRYGDFDGSCIAADQAEHGFINHNRKVIDVETLHPNDPMATSSLWHQRCWADYRLGI